MDDEPTIEELCKPISGKKMPRSALFNWQKGGFRSQEHARKLQRHKATAQFQKRGPDGEFIAEAGND